MYRILILTDAQTYDITSIVSDIEYYSDIEGHAGKLTFNISKDPSEIIKVQWKDSTLNAGDMVIFYHDSKMLFKGYVFTTEIDELELIKVTAYDQLRYLMNKDTFVTDPMTASDVFRTVCERALIRSYKISTPSSAVVQSKVWNMKTYYEILSSVLKETLIAEGKQYYILDKAGVLTFDLIENSDSGIVIGEASLLTNYRYTIDIDNNTYNRVIVQTGDEDEGITKVAVQQSEENIAKWGLLQSVLKLSSDDYTESIAHAYASTFLQVYNKPDTTMELTAIGDDSIHAGCVFTLNLPTLGIKSRRMYVKSVTHKYTTDTHIMDIEVAILAGDNYV